MGYSQGAQILADTLCGHGEKWFTNTLPLVSGDAVNQGKYLQATLVTELSTHFPQLLLQSNGVTQLSSPASRGPPVTPLLQAFSLA